MKLRALLRDSHPCSPLPPQFQESVWHRIENAEIPVVSSNAWLDRWLGRVLQPRFAVATLALALLAGGLIGVLNSADVKQQAQERYLSVVAPSVIR